MGADTQSLLIALHYAALTAVLAGATLFADRRHGFRAAVLVCAANLAVFSAVVLGFPIWSAHYPSNPSTLLYIVGSTVFLACVDAAALAVRPGPARRALGAGLTAQRVALVALAVLLPLGMAEAIAQLATRFGLVPYFVPVETRIAGQTEDWRIVHMIDDNFREPDPLLLWRPIPRYPYSSQRFKGPELAEPKPAGTVRLFCYGDSNTDGPSVGNAWPARLQQLIDARRAGSAQRYEVVNAGVGGYSSYQGVRRFAEEVDRFAPDLIFVSFGWNDAANAIGPPDKTFAEAGLLPINNRPALFVRRVLLGYRSLLVALHVYFRLSPPAPLPAAVGSPRVSLADYEANLHAFTDSAQRRGIAVVLLTRPHRQSPDELERDPTWRHQVPRYNAATLRVARQAHVLVIDVQRAFDGQPNLFLDECHLTNDGHRKMATVIFEALAAAGFVS